MSPGCCDNFLYGFEYVEVVVARDGEVPHPAVTLPRDPAADHGGRAASGGTQAGAVAEGSGFDPPAAVLAGAGDPDRVVAGRMNDGSLVPCLDFQVVQVGVVVDEDRSDRLRPGLPGPGIGGEDLVAGLELADGFAPAVSEQHLRRGGEAQPAGRSGSLRETTGFFCGKDCFPAPGLRGSTPRRCRNILAFGCFRKRNHGRCYTTYLLDRGCEFGKYIWIWACYHEFTTPAEPELDTDTTSRRPGFKVPDYSATVV